MTLLPLTECGLLLGVDPKTLRLWLKAANVSCTEHPGDARLKCLTHPQLLHLATLHGRMLPESLGGTSPTTGTGDASACNASVGASAEPASALRCSCACSEPSAHTDLARQFSQLQTQLVTLQEQVTHLALALLREREWGWQHQMSLPQGPLPRASHLDTSPLPMPEPPTPRPAPADLCAHEPRARSRALPLIEYGADGTYVLISPTQGVLSLLPDSPAWFEWVASVTAFTFHGAQGRFSATRKRRKGQRVQAWSAYRSLHGRSSTFYLGLTAHLTLAHLEHMATKIHSHLTSF